MSDRKLLMPKATAVWLVENTSLSFEQIAELCGLHVLEVKGIADGDVAQGIKGMDPISTGQLTREEIARGEEDHGYRLKLAEAKVDIPDVKSKKGPRYTPVSRRQDRPECGALAAAQPCRAQGQPDHAAGRHHQADDRRHPRAHALELAQSCSRRTRDARPVHADRPRQRGAGRPRGASSARGRSSGKPLEKAGTLLPTSQTIPGHGAAAGRWRSWLPKPAEEKPEETEAEEEARVFAKLREMGGGTKTDEDPPAVTRIRATPRLDRAIKKGARGKPSTASPKTSGPLRVAGPLSNSLYRTCARRVCSRRRPVIARLPVLELAGGANARKSISRPSSSVKAGNTPAASRTALTGINAGGHAIVSNGR